MRSKINVGSKINGELTEYVDHLVQGHTSYCQNTVSELLSKGWEVLDIFENLFYPSMVVVGERWEKNELSVAQEHIATCITETLITGLYPKIIQEKRAFSGLKAIITCIENEHHQLGTKMISYLLELWGIQAIHLGADVPRTDLMILTKTEKPDFIMFSITIYSNMPIFIETAKQLYSISPESEIIAGGQAFYNMQSRLNLPRNAKIFKTLTNLKNYIDLRLEK
ncbi:cobalamin B12-binding domain-containing protein [Sedimentisphaera salicampi]|uniref:cobalamin B12-binding domain-containing protein n=1 Tax=Sedimentisphaera salicampi TaxID=1941349 RepID=UPI000B9BFFB0|nr:B12-binding domain-containing protein [Sedimentisphaera salicampi]OXU16201.1 putative methyltransferase cognate corrinoid protein [Sedimentisphaera salicampi]